MGGVDDWPDTVQLLAAPADPSRALPVSPNGQVRKRLCSAWTVRFGLVPVGGRAVPNVPNYFDDRAASNAARRSRLSGDHISDAL